MDKYKNYIGWVSAFLIVLAYLLMTMEIIVSQSTSYNVMNLFGGLGLAYRVWLDRNYSNFILEVIFVGIAIINLLK